MSPKSEFVAVQLSKQEAASDSDLITAPLGGGSHAQRVTLRIVKCVLLLFLIGQLAIVLSGIMFGRQLFRRQLETSLAEGSHHYMTAQEREYLTSAEAIAETIFTTISVGGLLGIIIGIVGTLISGYCLILTYAIGGSVILVYWVAAIRLTALSSLNLTAGIASVSLAYWLAMTVKRQKKERDQAKQEAVPIYSLASP